jgi:hypothetical protein
MRKGFFSMIVDHLHRVEVLLPEKFTTAVYIDQVCPGIGYHGAFIFPAFEIAADGFYPDIRQDPLEVYRNG